MTKECGRRRVLAALSLAAVGSLAGCQSSDDGSLTDITRPPTEAAAEPSPDRETNTPAQTTEKTPAQLSIRVDTTRESNSGTVSIPPVWNEDDSIENYRIAVTASLTNAEKPLTDLQLRKDESVIRTRQLDAENQATLTVDPAELDEGVNNLYFIGSMQNGDTARSKRVEVEKKIPSAYRVDFTHGRNETLRKRATDRFGDDYFREHVGREVITNDPLLTNYSTPEGIEYSEKEIDLAALEYWHDNDVNNIREDEAREFLDAVGSLTEAEGIAKEAMEEPKGVIYENHEEDPRYGTFEYSVLRNAKSLHEALDQSQRLLFSWQRYYPGPGPISSEDEMYVAVLQEVTDVHTDIESHFWAFDLPEAARSTHGNGMAYDETNNTMHAIETISGPTTQTSKGVSEGDFQYHPEIQNSGYLDPENDAYNKWWHPLRFAEEYRSENKEVAQGFSEIDFETGKAHVSQVLRGITTGFSGDEINKLREDAGTAITNEYAADITNKLRSWNEDEDLGSEEFEQIKNASKAYNIAWKEDENYVIHGTVENPAVTAVGDQVIDRIWSDNEGAWDDIDAGLQGSGDTPSASLAAQPAA